jgi:hypothetical protein
MARYVVSTLNRDKKTISKKMFSSFRHSYSLDFRHGYYFSDKAMARKRRDEMNASDWAKTCGSVGLWVVINEKTMKVVK